jgi:hypothetical protein
MEKGDKYVTKMEEHLKQWDAEVERLSAYGQTKGVEARVAYQDCIKALRVERDEAHRTFGEMRVATQEAGRQMQSKMRVAWHTMQKALEKATADLRK